MKKKDLEKFKVSSQTELLKEVAQLKEKLWVAERDVRDGKLKNVRAPKILKKDIARLLTLAKNNPTNR